MIKIDHSSVVTEWYKTKKKQQQQAKSKHKKKSFIFIFKPDQLEPVSVVIRQVSSFFIFIFINIFKPNTKKRRHQ